MIGFAILDGGLDDFHETLYLRLFHSYLIESDIQWHNKTLVGPIVYRKQNSGSSALSCVK